jgi:hypothetical protein
MNNILLKPMENNPKKDENLLSVFRENKATPAKMHEGMSPKEVAEVVSDHLINIVEKQFEQAKDKFRQANR